MRIYEVVGSDVTTNTSVATLTLEHGDANGASSIMFKSPSTTSNADYAYIKYQDFSGATTNSSLLTIGIENDPTATATADRISMYAAGGSGFVGVNTLTPQHSLDVSGNARISGIVYNNDVEPTTTSAEMDIASTQVDGILNIGMHISRTGAIRIGTGTLSKSITVGSTSSGTTTIGGGTTLIQSGATLELGNNVGTNTITLGRDIAGSGTVGIATSETAAGTVNVANGTSSTTVTNIGRGNAINVTNLSAGTTVDISAAGQVTLRGSAITVNGPTKFNSDISLSQNVKLGSGSNSIAINKDISSQYALDVSGATIFRGLTTLIGEVSLNQNLNVAGRAMFGAPPTSTGFEVDVSGQMRIYEPIGSRAGIATGSLVLEHNDASGASSIVFRSKNSSASDYAYIQYEENVGGTGANPEKGLLTIGIENESGSGNNAADRISLFSANGSGFVGVNTKDPTAHLDVSGSFHVSNYSSNNFIGGNVNLTLPIPVINRIFANSATINSNSVTINSVTPSFYNGVYDFSASSFDISSGNYGDPFRAFDETVGTAWLCSFIGGTRGYNQNPYSIVSPFAYQGGTAGSTTSNYFTTMVGTAPISGEWLQVKLPTAFSVTKYSISRTEYLHSIMNKRLPSEFYLVGSNNGTTWTQLDFRNEVQNINPSLPNTAEMSFTINKTIAYTHFRIITTKITQSTTFQSNDGVVAIDSFRLYGEPVGYSMGKTTITNDLQLLGKVLANDTEVTGNMLFSSRVKQDYKDASYSSMNGFYALDHQKAPVTNIENAKKAISTWSAVYNPNATVSTVCWSTTLRIFCAVGRNKAYTSPNGMNWTVSDICSNTALNYVDVVWAPELLIFCAIARSTALDLSRNLIATSTNGVSWNRNITHEAVEDVINANGGLSGIAWSPELRMFNVTGTFGVNKFLYSYDGINWTSQNSPSNYYMVVWARDLKCFIFSNQFGNMQFGNSTGTGFGGNVPLSTALQNSQPVLVEWSSELKMLVAYGGLKLFTSYDGLSWRTVPNITFVNSGYVFGTWSAELGIFLFIESLTKICHVSSNGIDWSSFQVSSLPLGNYGNFLGKRMCWSPELGIFCIAPSIETESFGISSLTERIPTAYNLFNSNNGIQSVDQSGNWTFNKNATVSGRVGLGMAPSATFELDVSGQMRIFETVGTVASDTSGTLILEHNNARGNSSLVFKGPNRTIKDFAYVQYTDASNSIQPALKYDFASNVPATLTGGATLPSTGLLTSALSFLPTDNSFAWFTNTTPLNGITPAFCISFNQTNLFSTQNTLNVPRINSLSIASITPSSSGFSFSAWIKPLDLSYSQASVGRYYILYAAAVATATTPVIEIFIEFNNVVANQGKLFVLVNNDTNNYMVTTNEIPLNNTWSHIVFTLNNSTQSGAIYLNGSTTGTTRINNGFSGKTLNNFDQISIGGRFSALIPNHKGFRGQMVFLNIFLAPLSAEDVLNVYYPFRSLMTIGSQIENGFGNNGRVVLWPNAGQGSVGVNIRDPVATLDVSGSLGVSGTAFINTIDATNTTADINIGTGFTTAKNINIGKNSAQSSLDLRSQFISIGTSSTSLITVNPTAGGTLTLGSSFIAGTLTVGPNAVNSANLNIVTGTRIGGTFNLGSGDISGSATNVFSGKVQNSTLNAFNGDVSNSTYNFLNGNAVNNAIINIASGSRDATSSINIANNTSSAETLNIGNGSDRSGAINIGNGNLGSKDISIGGSNTTVYLGGLSVRIKDTGDGNFNVGRLPGASGTDAIGVNIASCANTSGTVQILNGSASTGNVFIGRGNAIHVRNRDAGTTVDISAAGQLTLRGSAVTVNGPTSFENGKTTFGSPPTTATSYQLDVSGRMRIYEPSGTVVTPYVGSLVLEHGDASGTSSILFTSKNNVGSDYAYIQYQENVGGTSNENGLLTIGIENDSTSGFKDRISLFAANGFGNVGVNTKDPTHSLDVNGTMRVRQTLAVEQTLTVDQTLTANTISSATAGVSSSLFTNTTTGNIDIGTGVTSGNILVGTNASMTGNVIIGNSITGSGGVRIGGNVRLGGVSNSIAINKDISSQYALDVSGATIFRGPTTLIGEVSLNQNLNVNGTLVTNSIEATSSSATLIIANNLRSGSVTLNSNPSSSATTTIGGGTINIGVSGNMTFSTSNGTPQVNIITSARTGGNLNAFTGAISGSNTFTNVFTGTISDTTPVNILTGARTSATLNLGSGDISGSTTNVFSGKVQSSTLNAFNGDVSNSTYNFLNGNATNTVINIASGSRDATSTINIANNTSSAETLNIGNGSSRSGSISIGGGSATKNILIGGHSGITYLAGGSLRIKDQGSGTFYVGRLPGDATTDNMSVAIAGGLYTSGDVEILDGSGSTGNVFIGRGNAIHVRNRDAGTTVDISAAGQLTLRGSAITVNGPTSFVNGKTTFGSPPTTTTSYQLDVSGQMRIYEPVGTVASDTSGSLILEHANAGGTSSIMFKGPNAATKDYAYVQYEDHVNVAPVTVFDWDLSFNRPLPPFFTDASAIFSTGSNKTAKLLAGAADFSLNWQSVSDIPNAVPSTQFCISFNNINVRDLSRNRISYLQADVGPTSWSSITTSLWINPSVVTDPTNVANNTSYNILDLSGTTSHALAMFINRSRLSVVLDGSTNRTNSVWTDVAANTWYHIVFSYDAITNRAALYKNNVLQQNVSGGFTSTFTTFNAVALGWRPGFPDGSGVATTVVGAQKGFAGQMYSVNIFNEVLTPNDVSNLYWNPIYNQPAFSEQGLLTIGIENDIGYKDKDRIVLWPSGGKGFVGINTKNPQTTLDVSGNIQAFSYNATSDYRAKDDVVPLNATFTVDVLNPVTYIFKATGKQDVGFIAHEVQEFYPFLVNGEKDGATNQSLNYNGFIGILTKEIKDLKVKVSYMEANALDQAKRIEDQAKRIEDQAKRIEDQHKRIEDQAKRIEDQHKRIDTLEKLVSELVNK